MSTRCLAFPRLKLKNIHVIENTLFHSGTIHEWHKSNCKTIKKINKVQTDKEFSLADKLFTLCKIEIKRNSLDTFKFKITHSNELEGNLIKKKYNVSSSISDMKHSHVNIF